MRWHSAAFLAGMLALAILALAAVLVSSRAVPTPLLDEHTMSAARELSSVERPAEIPLARAGAIELMLPIHERQVTAIGYHPVDDPSVISLNPHGRQINENILSSLGRMTGTDDFGYFVMGEGSIMGGGTESLDVGAPAGTFIFAPVDGVVAAIKSYDLKGQCPDTEIKIQPLDQSNIVVVMTHLAGIEASLGQPVKAGVTRLGAVRQLEGCMEQPLSGYTYDSGNNVHMQVEALGSPQPV